MHTLPPETVMYDAVARNDASFEGVFWLGVTTTGIFCRPTCTAKRPRAENVEYFVSPAAAERAGYRACLRCRPREIGDSPAWMVRLLAEVERRGGEPVRDDELAGFGVDAGTVRRRFRRRYGMTFQAYQRSRRMSRALASIRAGASLSRAALEQGYSSESGFREAFERQFGTTPGRVDEIRCLALRWMDTALGMMVGAADDEGLRLLEFAGARDIAKALDVLGRRLGAVVAPGEHPVLDEAESSVRAYLRGEAPDARVRAAQPGTAFQCAVWDRLSAIPSGVTMTYSEIAAGLGRAGGERAVGNACGANGLALVVPCHRVVRRDGSMGGYAGGVWRKRMLLDLERSAALV